MVRHKQIGADQETRTSINVARPVPQRYSNPTDFASELIVLTISRKVSHFLKVVATEDIIRCNLNFGEPVDIQDSRGDGNLENAVGVNDFGGLGVFTYFGGLGVFIGEGVCETKDGTQ